MTEHACAHAHTHTHTHTLVKWGSPGGSAVKSLPANAEHVGSTSGSGRSPGEGSGNPLQYSCLGNPMERRACQATVSPWDPKRARRDLVTEQQGVYNIQRDLTI